MKTTYAVFNYLDRNSGLYVADKLTLSKAIKMAINYSNTGANKAMVESGVNNYPYKFRKYEGGELTEWNF